MIGLKRGTVKLLPHNPKWSEVFEKENKILVRALNGLVVDIQHIGSTSIPGIPAKPIIDISIGIKSMKNSRDFIKNFKDYNSNNNHNPKFIILSNFSVT